LNSKDEEILLQLEQKNKAQRRVLIISLLTIILLIIVLVFIFSSNFQNVTKNEIREVTPITKTYDCVGKDKNEKFCLDRQNAMDTINQIQIKISDLEKKNVNKWGESSFAKAKETFEIGYRSFQAKKISKSVEELNLSLGILDNLLKEGDSIFTKGLNLGQKYLSEGNANLSIENFKNAEIIDNTDPRIIEGLSRAKVYDNIINQLKVAEELVKIKKLDQAFEVITSAYNLDKKNPIAKNSLKDIKKLILDRDFSLAINKGQKAIRESNIEVGVKSFSKALDLKPNSSQAKKGLSEILLLDKQIRINNLIKEASYLEDQEEWNSAMSLYKKIIDEDYNIRDAQQGFKRTKSINEFEKKIKLYINDPSRLTSPAIKKDAEKLLLDASNILNNQDKAPQFLSLRNQLKDIIFYIDKPRPVRFISDNSSILIITGVGEVEPFDNKIINLKPGNYEIRARKRGFIEKRIEVEINPMQNKEIYISCDERI
tara:strand:+ start:1727 stop:3181 length:1455 start_codon:yes stop_codon:yes gene_type:complete